MKNKLINRIVQGYRQTAIRLLGSFKDSELQSNDLEYIVSEIKTLMEFITPLFKVDVIFQDLFPQVCRLVITERMIGLKCSRLHKLEKFQS